MATSKKRLGRGLGNLISGGLGNTQPKDSPEKKKPGAKRSTGTKSKTPQVAKPATVATLPPPGTDEKEFREIHLYKIEPNPYQPRREIEEDKIKDLAESIRSEGLLQPIVVRSKGEDAYELIAGERRFRAHQSLGLKTVMARVVVASDASSAVLSLIENLQREGLNPIEESLGYASLMGDFDLTQEGVAERVGKSRASIANSLRLLQLEREIQGFLAKGMISTGHAKVILGVEDPAHRKLLARRVIEAGLSVRETEKLVRKFKNEGSLKNSGKNLPEAESTIIKDLEKQLSSKLNTNVLLKHTPKKGKLIIEYFGNEDLQRILEKMELQ